MAIRVKNTTAFDPRSISDCVLWLDSTDTSRMTLSGSSIRSIRDKTTGKVFTASATQPTLSSTAYSGLYPIRFNGASFLLNASFSYTLNNRSAFIVCGETAGGNNNGYLSFAISGTDYNQTNAIAFESGHKPFGQYFQIVASGLTASPTGPLNTPTPFAVYNDTFGSGAENLYSNGTLIKSATTATTYTNSTGLYLGARMVGGSVSNYLTGVIAEVILYNRAVTTSERQQIEGYLAWKWGLLSSLPKDHPSVVNTAIPFSYPTAPVRTKKTSFPTFDPRTISGCQMWLDGNDPNGTGVQPAIGSAIATWSDKSGLGRNLTQSTAGNRPVFANVNNRGMINFVRANNNYLINTSFTRLYSNFTLFLVIQRGAIADNARIFVAINPSYTDDWNSTSGFSFTTAIELASAGSGTIASDSGNLNLTIYTLSTNNNSASLYKNGATSTFLTRSMGQTGNSIGIVLGAGTASGGVRTSQEVFNGYMAEIILFQNPLSLAQQQQVEGYLAWKWGTQTSLSASHPNITYPVNPFQLSVPIRASSVKIPTVSRFTYTGSLQTFIVPPLVTSITVHLWGAGGGGSYNKGGAGAYLSGALTVIPGETLSILVGQGGRTIPSASAGGGTTSAYGGGGAVNSGGNANGYGNAGGGGRSAIQRGGSDVVTVGAGGGAGGGWGFGYNNLSGGAGSYNGSGTDGNGFSTTYSGKGGTLTGGGAGGVGGTAGSLNQGGSGDPWSGGGGSGYYGGGGASDNGAWGNGGGGGGSSYTANLKNISGENSSDRNAAPGTSSPYYVSGVAIGGYTGSQNSPQNGGNGLVVLVYTKFI